MKEAYFSLQFQEDNSPLWWEIMAASGRHGSRNKKLRAHVIRQRVSRK